MKLTEIDGKKVKDGKRGVDLVITAADVREGRKRKPDCCAAALACMRQLKAPRALVHLSRVYIERPKFWERLMTPSNLRTEIVSFDRGHKFSEGTYTLAPVYESVKLGKKRVLARNETGTHPQRGNRKRQEITGVRFAASPKKYA